MSVLSIELDNGRVAYRPGETLTGVASWQLDAPVAGLEVRLLWFTRGKGTQDVSVIAHRAFPAPPLVGRREFSFNLPDEPYSFSGRLISLIWALELVTPKGRDAQRVEIVMSPFGSEILLGDPADPGKPAEPAGPAGPAEPAERAEPQQ